LIISRSNVLDEDRGKGPDPFLFQVFNIIQQAGGFQFGTRRLLRVNIVKA
jgi:hypothetical protein